MSRADVPFGQGTCRPSDGRRRGRLDRRTGPGRTKHDGARHNSRMNGRRRGRSTGALRRFDLQPEARRGRHSGDRARLDVPAGDVMRRLRVVDRTLVRRCDRRLRRSRSRSRLGLNRFVRLSGRGRDRGWAWRARRRGRRGSGLHQHRLLLRRRGCGGRLRHDRRRVCAGDRNSRGRGRRRGGRRRRSRREEQERIEVSVLIACEADPEVHVRRVDLRRTARTDAGDNRSLLHACSAKRLQRPEMRQRGAVAVGRPNAEGESVAGRGSRERNDAVHRRHDGGAGGARDVDPAMLPGQLRLGTVEQEGSQHRPIRRPRPSERRTRHGERDHGYES
jgi:hypothetical protein